MTNECSGLLPTLKLSILLEMEVTVTLILPCVDQGLHGVCSGHVLMVARGWHKKGFGWLQKSCWAHQGTSRYKPDIPVWVLFQIERKSFEQIMTVFVKYKIWIKTICVNFFFYGS